MLETAGSVDELVRAEIQQLVGSELAKLKAKAEEYEKQQRDLLAEMAQHVETQIDAARQELNRRQPT
jgi:tRNA U34 5-carboxymethylaminomethyl modifying GTPase MnmE/TrmE